MAAKEQTEPIQLWLQGPLTLTVRKMEDKKIFNTVSIR